MTLKVHQMGAASAAPGASPIIGIAPAAAAPEAPVSKIPGVEVAEVNGKLRAYAKDSRGRRIGVRVVGFLDQFRMAKLLGDQSQNIGATNLALAVISVVEIDGEAVSFPSSETQLEFLMARLDQDGVAAAIKGLSALATGDDDEGATKN